MCSDFQEWHTLVYKCILCHFKLTDDVISQFIQFFFVRALENHVHVHKPLCNVYIKIYIVPFSNGNWPYFSFLSAWLVKRRTSLLRIKDYFEIWPSRKGTLTIQSSSPAMFVKLFPQGPLTFFRKFKRAWLGILRMPWTKPSADMKNKHQKNSEFIKIYILNQQVITYWLSGKSKQNIKSVLY